MPKTAVTSMTSVIFISMSDFSLCRREDGYYDLSFDGQDLQTGKSLESAVVLSVGSDARATRSFSGKLGDDGWWAESTFDGDRWGNLLHTIFQGKNDSNAVLLAKRYVDDSLRWLVEDGVVGSVETSVTKNDYSLDVSVDIFKGRVKQNFRFEFLWSEVA